MNHTSRLLALCALSLLCSPAVAQRPSKEYNDALRDGVKLVNDKKYAEAQAPLETALKASANDDERKRVYQALVPVYRQLPEIDKFLEAHEFNIRHEDRKAGRSNAASDIASFLFQRGKLDAGIARYEAALKADAKDPAALGVLAVIYSRQRENKDRAAAVTAQLESLNVERATALATRLEKDADAAPQTAAWWLKEAALVWLEAGDKAKALAAAKKSLAQPPEQRNGLLTYQWRGGLGDVLLASGETALAVQQFEAAVAAAPEPLRKTAEKKLAEVKSAAEKKP